jgi:hypothetical protein
LALPYRRNHNFHVTPLPLVWLPECSSQQLLRKEITCCEKFMRGFPLIKSLYHDFLFQCENNFLVPKRQCHHQHTKLPEMQPPLYQTTFPIHTQHTLHCDLGITFSTRLHAYWRRYFYGVCGSQSLANIGTNSTASRTCTTPLCAFFQNVRWVFVHISVRVF